MLMTFKYVALAQTSFLNFRFTYPIIYWLFTLECPTYILNQCVLSWIYFTLPKLLIYLVVSIFLNSTTIYTTAKLRTLHIIHDSFISLISDSTFLYFLVLFSSPTPVLLCHLRSYHLWEFLKQSPYAIHFFKHV